MHPRPLMIALLFALLSPWAQAQTFDVGCRPGGAVELWTITAGAHSPTVSESYAAQLVEWLYDHPKPATP